jgi:hypothetical protein
MKYYLSSALWANHITIVLNKMNENMERLHFNLLYA